MTLHGSEGKTDVRRKNEWTKTLCHMTVSEKQAYNKKYYQEHKQYWIDYYNGVKSGKHKHDKELYNRLSDDERELANAKKVIDDISELNTKLANKMFSDKKYYDKMVKEYGRDDYRSATAYEYYMRSKKNYEDVARSYSTRLNEMRKKEKVLTTKLETRSKLIGNLTDLTKKNIPNGKVSAQKNTSAPRASVNKAAMNAAKSSGSVKINKLKSFKDSVSNSGQNFVDNWMTGVKTLFKK